MSRVKRGVLLVLLISVLCTALASAAAVKVSHTGPSYVQAGAIATFTLTLTNSQGKGAWLTITPDIFANLPSSKFDYIITDQSQVKIPAFSEKKINVTVKLKDKVEIGEIYGTYVTIKSINDPSIRINHNLVLRVVSPNQILRFSAIVPKSFLPGKKATIQVQLKNRLNSQVNNIDLHISSELFTIKKTLSLFPFQDRIENIAVDIPKTAKAGSYAISVRTYYNNEQLAKETGSFKVLKTTEVKEQKEIRSNTFSSIFKITKTNNGNYAVDEKYDHKLSFLHKMFASYNPEPTFKDKDGVHWRFTLDPQKSYTITLKINFRPIFYVLAVVIAFAVLSYLFFRKTVLIKKHVYKLKQITGQRTQLKVMLIIKNKTGKPLKNLTVVEILPSVIKPSTKFGTLKPNKVQKGTKGIRLTWIIPELAKSEERIISYEVKSQISIIGGFNLPRTLLRYRGKSGKMTYVYSNKLNLLTGIE